MAIKKIKDPVFIQLSVPYQKLNALIETINSIDLNDWTIMHSLAYICFKYKEKFGTEYVLSYDATPSKCYEYKLCSRIWAMLQARACEGRKVKEFIDWFFDTYYGKNPFKSVGALSKADVIIKYQQHYFEQAKITTNTLLPENIIMYVHAIKEFDYVKTYGDLYYLYKS